MIAGRNASPARRTTPAAGAGTAQYHAAQEVSTMFHLSLAGRCAAAAVAVGVSLAAASLPAVAHHGWAWAEDGNSQLSGQVVTARLGNPHGELTLDVGGANWVVEVGQPWRNERAGLKDAMLSKGAKLTVAGHRHADPDKKVFKAERVMIDGKTYDLYPDRK
jgi:hypothetical protein